MCVKDTTSKDFEVLRLVGSKLCYIEVSYWLYMDQYLYLLFKS